MDHLKKMNTDTKKILISVIVPIRNEEKIILSVLESLKKQILPYNTSLEILLIDGLSDDNTLKIISDFKHQNLQLNIKILENKMKYSPHALNIGIKNSLGNYICRIDAHTIYPIDYIKNCLETILLTDADNVGGYIITKKFNDSLQANLVQAVSTHKFGVGNSGFRIGREDGYADTVPFGFFKKSIFDKVGAYNELLIRAQDYEMNRRISKEGGKIWFSNKIFCSYFNQKSLIDFLKKQLFLEAPYNVYMWYLAPYTIAIRHGITLFFSLGVIVGLFIKDVPIFGGIYYSVMFLYLILALISSLQQSIRFKKLILFPLLPICFFSFHFIHGIGMIVGLTKVIFRIAPVQKKVL